MRAKAAVAKAKAKAKAKPKAAAPAKKKPAAKPKKTAAAAPQEKQKQKQKAKAGLDGHPGYALLAEKLTPGRYAGGGLLITPFGAHDEEMAPWLMHRTDGRRAIGRTAFGDIVVFRDLRERARELGLDGAESAGDVAIIDIHYKRMTMIADSAESLLSSLDRPEWQKEYLRADLHRKAKKRLGDYADDECFCFVLALSMGGSEDASSVQRANWRVHQDLLFQT